MELNVETNRERVHGAHEPPSHSLASTKVAAVKRSGCTVWQVNFGCSFVNLAFHICGKHQERV